jgi:hypothetical protein
MISLSLIVEKDGIFRIDDSILKFAAYLACFGTSDALSIVD